MTDYNGDLIEDLETDVLRALNKRRSEGAKMVYILINPIWFRRFLNEKDSLHEFKIVEYNGVFEAAFRNVPLIQTATVGKWKVVS